MRLASIPNQIIQTHLMVFAMSCGKLPGFSVNDKTDAFVQSAIINDKIDILFVVDNSGSMTEEQNNLAESFSDFIEGFSQRKLDFHIGVVSTDVTNNTQYWAATGSHSNGPYKNFANKGPGSLLGYKTLGVINPRIITSDTPNLIDVFKENVTLGVNGSGAEAGIYSVLFAFAEIMIGEGGWNEGFLRSEALLSVIFLSDEDESRGRGTGSANYLRSYPTEHDARVTQFEALLNSLKPEKADLLRVDAIVAPSKAECPSVYVNNGVVGTGNLYMEAAAKFGGATMNICQNFAADLLELGSDLLTLLTRFKLVQKPDGQIEVRVNGQLVQRDIENGWEYLAETQEVEFRGSVVPSADSVIEVTYVPGEPLR
jgi:hypothetical protein